jgi:hypothetical protein
MLRQVLKAAVLNFSSARSGEEPYSKPVRQQVRPLRARLLSVASWTRDAARAGLHQLGVDSI